MTPEKKEIPTDVNKGILLVVVCMTVAAPENLS